MNYLDKVFQLVLHILGNVVNDDIFSATFWMFIIVITLLLFISFVRAVKTWA